MRKLKPDTKGPILCFVGPPGVGKTSLGRSIARALGRKFVRLSLGGVRDEAEIRGHRRTYVGALPGRILQGIHQAGTTNPVFMLDEIDKIGADFRGDPSSALLEVLDPEQNSTFRDHYLGVALRPLAGDVHRHRQPARADPAGVPRPHGGDPALRLHRGGEAARSPRRHLIPKQLEENGLERRSICCSTATASRKVISDYTREAGLRNLERELAAICRKVAVRVARGPTIPAAADRRSRDRRRELLGPAKHLSEELLDRDRVGVATGLAWTAAGGDLLFIEVVAVPGKGQLALTGQLGEVMKESAQAALSATRARAAPAREDGDAPRTRASSPSTTSTSTSRRARSPRTARRPASRSPPRSSRS